MLRTEAFAWPSVADIIAGVVAQGDRYLVYTPVARPDGGDGRAAQAGGFQSELGAT